MRVAGYVVLAVLLMPAGVAAQQSAIAGEVADDSGGVLPGVTVEVASPALIEGVRTAFSDGEGRYAVTNLPPGAYTVTFTLPGFSTILREGVELASGFTASIDAAMQVGGIEETITVTGAAPLVDVQNVRQQVRVTTELRAELPSGAQGLMSVAKLVPGMTSALDQGGGGALGIYGSNQSTSSTYHGKGSTTDFYDGMQVNNLSGIGSVSYVMNPATVSETNIQTGGVSAESASGFAINMIPKEGGNSFSGSMDGMLTGKEFQNSNVEKIRDRGIKGDGQKNLRAYDSNFTLGGPIASDKVWFFAAVRAMGTKNEVPDMFVNTGQGTPHMVLDLNQPVFNQDWLRSVAIRLTTQLSERNKLNIFGDTQSLQTRGWQSNAAPEAQTCWDMFPQGVWQASWVSTVSSRLLVEAGAGLTKGPFPCPLGLREELYGFTTKATDIGIQEATTGYRYNAASNYLDKNDNDRYMQRGAMSYVTGSHNAKVGFTLQQHINNRNTSRNMDQYWRFRNGLPNRVTIYAPSQELNRTDADLGIYAQDQWVMDKLTLNVGIRFDYFKGSVPEQSVTAGLFVPARTFPAVTNVPNWTDIDPRVGISYDVFGTGRTAIKATYGRYIGKEAVSVARAFNPIFTQVNSTNIAWSDTNGDYKPDCDFLNPLANGECGKYSNSNFGKANPKAFTANTNLTEGFGTRDYYWDAGLELQHELSPGVSFRVGYYRNWSDHFRALPRGDFRTVYMMDNQSVTSADFSPYSITAPLDSRLPGGGGYVVSGLYDISEEKYGVGDVIATRPGDYGDGQSRVSDFVTASIDARLDNGLQLGGSVDMGQTIEDRCFTVDSPQQLLNCKSDRGWDEQVQVKFHAVQPLPGDFVISATVQNLAGSPWLANYSASTSLIAPSLGRPLAGGRKSVTVPLIAPFELFEPRRNLVDARVSKVFNLANGMRLQTNLDVYNLMNDASILSVNGSFGSKWGAVGSRGLAAPRLYQISGRLSF